MPRAVASTLLPAARPASTIARPRPRELPVTNHTCAIHPPVYRSQPLGYSVKASQPQDWMHDGYTNGLVSYGGNRRIFRSQGYSLRVRESQEGYDRALNSRREMQNSHSVPALRSP